MAIFEPVFSPDSELLAFRWDDKVRVVSTSTLEMVNEYENQSDVMQLAFSPNGKYLAVGSWKDIINIYKVGAVSEEALVGTFKGRT